MEPVKQPVLFLLSSELTLINAIAIIFALLQRQCIGTAHVQPHVIPLLFYIRKEILFGIIANILVVALSIFIGMEVVRIAVISH